MKKLYFTLHLNRPGGSYRVCFCYQGETKWINTATPFRHAATRIGMQMQDEVLRELAERAAGNAFRKATSKSDHKCHSVAGSPS